MVVSQPPWINIDHQFSVNCLSLWIQAGTKAVGDLKVLDGGPCRANSHTRNQGPHPVLWSVLLHLQCGENSTYSSNILNIRTFYVGYLLPPGLVLLWGSELVVVSDCEYWKPLTAPTSSPFSTSHAHKYR